MGFPTRYDTHQAVQLQKIARRLKVLIKQVEGLYYLYSETKGADQLHSYHTAPTQLICSFVFAYAKSRFSHDAAAIFLQAGDCTLREAVIIASILTKNSIPMLHSAAAILKIAEMDYTGANSIFLRALLDKKYALPYRVVDAVVFHFVR